MIDYEKELNPEQLRVVLEEGGPLLVIAGAGSGKTRTLTYRVARLMESGIPPERILLATFTNKAARSMLSRVETLIGREIGGLWGGTFHHCAHLTLRAHAHHLGYERNFSILDSEDARQLINTCITEAGVDAKSEKFPRGEVVGEMISLSVNTETDLLTWSSTGTPSFRTASDEITAVAERYRKRKKELNVMDFDDLLFNWRELLLHFADVREAYAGRFLQILVDEYQDTNRLQAEIMDLLASRHRNLMVVGDDSQSIYSFRGANYENIMRFPDRYPDCRIFKLETNYRSTPEILHLANLSITNNENQFQKTLRAVTDGGDTPRPRPDEKCPAAGRFRRPADPRTPPKRHPAPGDGRPLPRPLPFDGGTDGDDPPGNPLRDPLRDPFLRTGAHQGRDGLPQDHRQSPRRAGLETGARALRKDRPGDGGEDLAFIYPHLRSSRNRSWSGFRECAGKSAIPGLGRFQETFCALHGATAATRRI